MNRETINYQELLDGLPVVVMRLSYLHEKDFWQTWFINEAIEGYGYSQSDFASGALSWADIVHPDDLSLAARQARDYMRDNVDEFKLEYRIVSAQGEPRWITGYSRIVRDGGGGARCVDSMLLNAALAGVAKDAAKGRMRQQLVLNDILLSIHGVDTAKALQIILDRTGAHLDVSRAMLFRCDDDRKACRVIHEWRNKGVALIRSLCRSPVDMDSMPEISDSLKNTGMVLVNAGEIPENCRKEFEREGVAASAIFTVHLRGESYGYIRFDDCAAKRAWDGDTANFLRIVSNLVSTVLMRMETERRLSLSHQTCETVLDNVNSYIFATNPETGAIIFANRAFREVFGQDCIGRPCSDYLPIHSHSAPACPESAQNRRTRSSCPSGRGPCLSGQGEAETDERPCGPAAQSPCCSRSSGCGKGHGQDGCSGCDCSFTFSDLGDKHESGNEAYLPLTGQWLAWTTESAIWVDGRDVSLVTCYDITAKKNYEQNIRRLAFQDHLTGLPNRYRCNLDLEHCIERAGRLKRPGYLIFIDLDDFKIVNDCFGHDYGDGVLKSFAEYLGGVYKSDGHVFRFGGDEFVIIVKDADEGKIKQYLETMLERAKRPWRSLDKEFYCGLSIGVVEFSGEGDTGQSILKTADIAMYQAKKTGKNNYVFYTEGLDSAAVARSEMEAMLRKAMENEFQGFEIHYQPYSSLTERRIIGAEALLRMRDGRGNLLLPSHFIPLAEYLGFIVPLGEHVLREAAKLCKAKNDAGLKDFSVTVNLSAKQFKQKDLILRLEKIIEESGVNYSNVIIAINEGVAISELERMLLLCKGLRAQGIKVALDDFGSGSSSFINMRDLPADIIKISSSYIDSYEDEFTGYFIRMATDLGHFSKKLVCVNGVETKEQFEFCKKMGVDLVQGFLLHKPGSLETLNAILK